MTRYLPGTVLAAFAIGALPAWAQPPGSISTWVEACELPADLEGAVANNVMIVQKEALAPNPDGSYQLLHDPFLQITFYGFPQVLCPGSLFQGQDRVAFPESTVAPTTRSAVQVGPDLVLTAWHGRFSPANVGNYRVVFGLRHRQFGDTCVPPDFDVIPASQVFAITGVVADGYVNSDPIVDMVLLRLDRVIADTLYPRVRRSGRAWPGDSTTPADSVTMIGHPERLDAKVDTAGVAGTYFVGGGVEWLRVANLHALDRSSGSMVYNRTQRILETVNRSGAGTDLLPHGVPPNVCYTIEHENGWFERNASLRHFAQHIPAFELLVNSLDPFVHVLPVGAPPDDTANSRTVKAPSTVDAPIAYQIVPPGPAAPGQPSLSIVAGGPLTGTLAPGLAFPVSETVDITGVPCGYYERHYEIRDLTNGFVDLARHVFEVGIREFEVGEGVEQIGTDQANPLEDEIDYPVRNPRPTPVVVRATASASWVTLNGVASKADGPPVSLDLQLDGHGSTVLHLGVAPWAGAFARAGTQDTSVSFRIADGDSCPTVGGTVVREFAFTYGMD